MFQVFTDFADWIVFSVFNLSAQTKLGDALHFFVEDVSKIFRFYLCGDPCGYNYGIFDHLAAN
jgi:hypothetical protein